MESIFVDITNNLQLFSIKLPGYCNIIQADFKLNNGFITPITRLLILFL